MSPDPIPEDIMTTADEVAANLGDDAREIVARAIWAERSRLAAQQDIDPLVARLLDRASFFDGLREWDAPSGALEREAATALRAQAGQIAALTRWNRLRAEDIMTLGKQVGAAEARLADALAALEAAKRLCDNINEFGRVTDSEFYDHADTMIRAVLSRLTAAAEQKGGDHEA